MENGQKVLELWLGFKAPCTNSDACPSSIMTLEVMREDNGFTRYKETGSLGYHLEESPAELPSLHQTVEEGKQIFMMLRQCYSS